MKAKEITVGVNVQMNVDESTAQACLKMVQMYMNQTGVQVQADTSRDGETTLEFVDLRKPKDEREIEIELLKIEINSLMQEKEVLQNTIEKLEDEIERLERELNES